MESEDGQTTSTELVVVIETPEYTGPERRQDHIIWRTGVDLRLDHGAKKMRDLQSSLAENTAMTAKVQADTGELVALLQSFKGAFDVLEKLGKLAKPLGYIAMALGAVVTLLAAVKGGGAPK